MSLSSLFFAKSFRVEHRFFFFSMSSEFLKRIIHCHLHICTCIYRETPVHSLRTCCPHVHVNMRSDRAERRTLQNRITMTLYSQSSKRPFPQSDAPFEGSLAYFRSRSHERSQAYKRTRTAGISSYMHLVGRMKAQTFVMDRLRMPLQATVR